MIRQTIGKLQQTLQTEAETYRKLENELIENQLLNNNLQESESRYRSLFSLSPSAKLIFDADNLYFLEINRAASDIYGYSEAEFLNMKLTGIHPPENIPELLKHIVDGNHSATIKSRHIRKDGSLIDVEILRCNIELKGKSARMIVVNDITRQVEQVNAIHKQNAKLKEIAYIQSHLVRMPLTKIMALTSLIADEFQGSGDPKLLSALAQSSDELDQLIRIVVSESENILHELE